MYMNPLGTVTSSTRRLLLRSRLLQHIVLLDKTYSFSVDVTHKYIRCVFDVRWIPWNSPLSSPSLTTPQVCVPYRRGAVHPPPRRVQTDKIRQVALTA